MEQRLLIISNAYWAPTGYGSQAKQLVTRLKADGWDVAMAANWGLTGAPMDTELGKVFPQGSHPYSIDVMDLWAKVWFNGGPGRVLTLYDTWVLLEKPDLLQDYQAYYWAPIDHAPPPPKVRDWCRNHDIIAMSQFGRDQMTVAGVPPMATIPHGIETDIFTPTESDIRRVMDVPDDAFLVCAANANIGQTPVRKSWFENAMAFRIFAESHPDAFLYLHTQLRHPRGVDLATFITMWGLPRDRIRIVDQSAYQGGMVSQQDLAAIFTAADVMLAATAGEGFGLTPLEGIACGTPAIGTDFSAQPEVIGDAGWLVEYAPLWDYQQAALQATPSIDGIVRALEQAYETSKDQGAADAMRERCLAQAAKYDADTVYAEQWRPFWASTEIAPKKQRRRKNAA